MVTSPRIPSINNFRSIAQDKVYRVRQAFLASADAPIIVVGSAHKVGSTWLVNLLADLFLLPRLKIPSRLAGKKLKVDVPLEAMFEYLSSLRHSCIHKTHAFPPKGLPQLLKSRLKLITVVRDPRDMLVSSAHYLANLPEHEGGWGASFGALSVKQRILRLVDEGDFLLERLDAWAHAEGAIQVRYEDLKNAPRRVMREIAIACNLPFHEGRAGVVIDNNDFSRRARRKPGVEDESAFLRKGIVGDWINVFDDDVIDAFNTGKEGRWRSLTIDLGYI
jgi:hypothetical protein